MIGFSQSLSVEHASVSIQKALKDSMAELAKEVRLAASYGELSDSLQQRAVEGMGTCGTSR